MTLHSGAEQAVWQGESHNVAAKASGGRLTLHYRLTSHYLYFETGGITGTKQEQVPLINVQDVDISQSLIQKSRKVGNVLVHITRANGVHETAVFDSVQDPVGVRDLINQTVHQVRIAAHQRQVAEQQALSTHRFDYNGGPVPTVSVPGTPVVAASPAPVAAATTPEDVMSLLKQLGELRDAGVVTPEEFEAKKTELLRRL